MISGNWYCIHPQTHLREAEILHEPSNCGACECPIAGKMYSCTACNSDLHPFCKSCPPTLSSTLHPAGHPLTLLNRDFTHALLRRCAVCSEDINGVSYACSPCSFDLHPQCSQLPLRVPCGAPPGDRRHSLELQVAAGSRETDCGVCGSRCGQWSYRCDACSVGVHYWCLSLKLAGAASDDHQSRGFVGPTVDRGFFGHGGAAGSPPWGSQPFGHGHYDHYRNGYNAPQPYYYDNSNGFPNHGSPWLGLQCNNNNNNNHNYSGGGLGVGGGGSLMGRIVGRLVGSLAVNLLCEMANGFSF